MQTGPSIRESLVALLTAVWYILVYGTSAVLLLARADPWLALPVAGLVRRLSGDAAGFRAAHARPLQGHVGGALAGDRADRRQLHQHPHREAVRARRATRTPMCARRSTSTPACSTARCGSTRCSASRCRSLNAMMVTGTGGLALYLWTRGQIEVGAVAMALPMSWQIVSMSGWVAWQVTNIFENIGVVQEGMMTIAQPITLTDRPDAKPLAVHARRDRVRRRALRLRPRTSAREDGLAPMPCSRASRSTVQPGREDRPGRPLRRRQVDGGQPAAALLRPRRRPHPDRRPGHRRR